MSQPPESTSDAENDLHMRQLRALLLGKNAEVVKKALQENAREVVSEVFSEALFDREKHDGSVNKVLLPLVEKSVEKSVTNHSEQMVGYLYPLVGSLVRKSLSAFITDLLEKTNTLIENSLSIKGLKWRFRAWQSGVSFSQYVTSQTFSFRVEQVFLIHRETGLLLTNLSAGFENNADADLISSMLTAINDFVADSFRINKDNSEQQLDVVKTDDFTLVLKPGPHALLVAAISGNMPQKVANQLQLSIEEIHRLYGTELVQFKGDTAVFDHCEQQLRDCLISELKTEVKAHKKRPWMALLIVFGLMLGLAYTAYLRWQTQTLLSQVQRLDDLPGIVVTEAKVSGLSQIELSILRDPSAQKIENWLDQQQINKQVIRYKEQAYVSLDATLIKQKVQAILTGYPNIEISWQNDVPYFQGKLTNLDKLRLQNTLNKIPGLDFKSNWLENIQVVGSPSNAADDPTIIRAILDRNIAKLDRVTIKFEQGQSSLSELEIEKLFQVKEEFNNLISVAQQQALSLGLIIMGASDPSGSDTYNKALSQKRADAVKNKLQELGIDKNRLNAIGLGTIDLKTSGAGARKVLFNVVYFDAN